MALPAEASCCKSSEAYSGSATVPNSIAGKKLLDRAGFFVISANECAGMIAVRQFERRDGHIAQAISSTVENHMPMPGAVP
jgi:hypothetical protein